jgi:hypothetical protein
MLVHSILWLTISIMFTCQVGLEAARAEVDLALQKGLEAALRSAKACGGL